MFNKTRKSAIVAGLLLSFALPTFAWDEVGHKITAYIAWQRMTPDVREKVIKILWAAPEDAQLSTFYLGSRDDREWGPLTNATRKRDFFLTSATWPDIIRDKALPVRMKNYNHPTWHYTDTLWTMKDGKVVVVETTDEGGQAMKVLSDMNSVIRGTASDADKAIAIAWLEHLIGDIHQPLHAASKVYNDKPDNGGNAFYLTPKGAEKSDNLHSFWDSIVLRYMPNTGDKCDADYMLPIADDIMRLYPYDSLKGDIADDKFDTWREESYKIATTEVYQGVTFGKTPSDEYKKKAFQIAQRRLALGGYRLGDLFNEVFGTVKPAGPAAPGHQ